MWMLLMACQGLLTSSEKVCVEEEIPYDGVDNDCSLTTPDDDLDLDGASGAQDCDDLNPALFPGNLEVPYDYWDNDCDPLTPDDDLDADGVEQAADCDDQNAALSPLNTEIPYDSLDNDCSPASPDDDLDADGALFATDCDDQNAALSPLNTEIPYDSLDNDCSPSSPDDDLDADGALAATDCDDSDATSYPGAPESCEDGVDQDCDGADSSCTVSTANFQDAPCTGYYPYDQPGAGWSWEGSQSGGSYRWTVTTSGRSTFDGLDVWGLTINGSASWSGGTYQEQIGRAHV